MRSYIKILCICLVFALTLPCLFACNKTEEVQSTPTESQKPSETEAQESGPLLLAKDGKSDFTIIRPSSSSAPAITAASRLYQAFKNMLGAEPTSKSDALKKGTEPDSAAKEILIGKTNRPESEQALAALGDNDYLIKVIGNKLTVVAKDDALLIRAVQTFINEYIVPCAMSKELSISRDLVKIGENSESKVVTDNGDGTLTLDLSYFVITYDNAHEREFVPAAAKAFYKRVQKVCDLASLTEDKNVNRYEILFGACDREEYSGADKKLAFRDYTLKYANGKLSIDAYSIYGYECAIDHLIKAYTNGGLTISKDGLHAEYDYGETEAGKILQNYENLSQEDAWIVNICHRGDVTNGLPENSIPSYQSCIDNGIDVIESDLRKTKDGIWVLMHDATVDRTTTGGGNLSNFSYQQLSEFYLKSGNGGGDAAITEYKIPTLDEIIDLCKGKVLLNLDKLDLTLFEEVYTVFEAKNAVDMAMFKASCSADDIINWFEKLLAQGRKLPLFSPMIYGEPEAAHNGTEAFCGLTVMIETGNGHTPETLAHLQSFNIRPMCLTALNPSIDNAEIWDMLKGKGYGAIMTDQPIAFADFAGRKPTEN